MVAGVGVEIAIASSRGEMSICTETYVKAENVTEQTSQ
jgi:hypothetical protein